MQIGTVTADGNRVVTDQRRHMSGHRAQIGGCCWLGEGGEGENQLGGGEQGESFYVYFFRITDILDSSYSAVTHETRKKVILLST